MIRHINDPEHPLTLVGFLEVVLPVLHSQLFQEQLKVVEPDLIRVDDAKSTVDLLFTPVKTLDSKRFVPTQKILTLEHRQSLIVVWLLLLVFVCV
jgi:hypothetical protein